jgi:hypothetical protein
MARHRNTGKSTQPRKKKDFEPPEPFVRPPEVLKPLIDTLEEQHAYVLHVDTHRADHKRRIFMIPLGMNIAVIMLFIWRMYHILPWYLDLFMSTLGHENETTLIAADMTWKELAWAVSVRAATFMIDVTLSVFLYPWPLDFFLGQAHGNPVNWRWSVGFRDKEVVARRSRRWFHAVHNVTTSDESRSQFLARIQMATAPMYLQEKTGYLTMNAEWELDYGVMSDATKMVDTKMSALEAFTLVVLVYQVDFGWLCVDMKQGENAEEDERRRLVFAFRDALAVQGKESLFYRWIELIQYESTQPGGFGEERQAKVAEDVRTMFRKEDIDFDAFWKESTGTEATT